MHLIHPHGREGQTVKTHLEFHTIMSLSVETFLFLWSFHYFYLVGTVTPRVPIPPRRGTTVSDVVHRERTVRHNLKQCVLTGPRRWVSRVYDYTTPVPTIHLTRVGGVVEKVVVQTMVGGGFNRRNGRGKEEGVESFFSR